MPAKQIINIHKVPNKIYDKGWNWAAKHFGTWHDHGNMLTDEGAFAMNCYLAGIMSTKRKRKNKSKK